MNAEAPSPETEPPPAYQDTRADHPARAPPPTTRARSTGPESTNQSRQQMAANGSSHPKAWQSLLAAVAAGHTLKAAAKHAGMSERTAARRAAEPSFRRALRAARSRATERAADSLTQACTAAARVMRATLKDEDARTRLSAAQAILRAAAAARQLADIDARLRRLERKTSRDHR